MHVNIFKKKNFFCQIDPSQDVCLKLASRYPQGILGPSGPRVLVYQHFMVFFFGTCNYSNTEK